MGLIFQIKNSMNYNLTKIISIIKNLIFVPKCVSCGERLSPIPEKGNMTYNKICFCKKCGDKWEEARTEICPDCRNLSEYCRCVPSFFLERQPNVPAVCFYHPEENDVQSKTVLSMKHYNNGELFDFVAVEIYPKIAKTLTKMGISGEDCIFTWTPRKTSSVSKYGFDQGKELSVKVAALFGSRAYPIFLRFGGKEQKKLSKDDRTVNAQHSIVANHAMIGFPANYKESELCEFICGKNIVIIDDVLTSGATLKQAVELMEEAGAERVIVACVSKSSRRQKEQKS